MSRLLEFRSFLRITVMLMALVGMNSCSNEDNAGSYEADPSELLYGEWRLVGWNDGGTWFEVDTNYVSHRHLSIEIPNEGIVKAYSIVNEAILGEMTVKGNVLLFSSPRMITKVGCNIMESNFFEAHIFGIKSYQMDGNLLWLYYSDNDYFVFTNDFDDSEANLYAWKNSVADPYIGEVTSMSEDEIEVKILHHPSSINGYTRNLPPASGLICHIDISDFSGLSFTTGDRIAFRIIQFRRLKGDAERQYQCVAIPYESTENVTDVIGIVHYDRFMGWCIIDVAENDRNSATYYYPMTALPESYLSEGQPVIFSGTLYPTWNAPSQMVYPADSCYYVSIVSLKIIKQ